ncbi:MAG TPA: YIP1 family protein [Bryobacteraceae bacterium]|nr:YIP1 family protein [Bryobacteraceae bacterium]
MLLSEVTVNELLALLNVFINPSETVRRIRGKKIAWFLPVLLGGVIMAAFNYTQPRMMMQVLRNNPPAGVSAAENAKKLDEMAPNMEAQARFSTVTAPMFVALMALMTAGITFAACVILQINVRFPDLFNLVAYVNIIDALQTLAHLLVLRGRGDAVTMYDLTHHFGLDLLLAGHPSKLLTGIATYFSIFTVWHIVAFAFGLAALANISKGKAFLATAPGWVIGLLSALVGALARP